MDCWCRIILHVGCPSGHPTNSVKALPPSVLMAIFPAEPGLAGFIEANDGGSGGA